MKKFVCLALAVICLFVFAACNQDSADIADRWNSESADFSAALLEDGDNGFIAYSETAGTQVKPDAVEEGSLYSYEINSKDGNWELKQTLVVKETFLKSNHSFLENDAWKAVVNNDASVFSVNAGGDVTFTSTMTSTVVFKTFKNGGAAVSSEKTVKSVFVYIGSEEGTHEIAYNNFTVSAKYTGKNAEVKFTDNDPAKLWDKTDGDVKITSGVYDNEMLFFVIRAYALAKVIELGGASFSAFNAFEQSTQTITVLAADDAENKEYAVKVYPTDQPNYPYWFYFETQEIHRPSGSATGRIPAYELIRFSQGYLKFTAK